MKKNFKELTRTINYGRKKVYLNDLLNDIPAGTNLKIGSMGGSGFWFVGPVEESRDEIDAINSLVNERLSDRIKSRQKWLDSFESRYAKAKARGIIQERLVKKERDKKITLNAKDYVALKTDSDLFNSRVVEMSKSTITDEYIILVESDVPKGHCYWDRHEYLRAKDIAKYPEEIELLNKLSYYIFTEKERQRRKFLGDFELMEYWGDDEDSFIDYLDWIRNTRLFKKSKYQTKHLFLKSENGIVQIRSKEVDS